MVRRVTSTFKCQVITLMLTRGLRSSKRMQVIINVGNSHAKFTMIKEDASHYQRWKFAREVYDHQEDASHYQRWKFAREVYDH